MSASAYKHVMDAEEAKARLRETGTLRLLFGGVVAAAAGLLGSTRLSDCAYRICGNPRDRRAE